MAGEDYTISVDPLQTTTGETLKATSYTFTTVPQGLCSYGALKLMVDGATIQSREDIREDSIVSAEVTVQHTQAGAPLTGVIYLAAYDARNQLMAAKRSEEFSVTEGFETLKVQAHATTDGFYGADAVRAFLFKSEESLMPLQSSVDFISDYVSFAEAEFGLGEVTSIGIKSAKLGTDAYGAGVTRDGRTGWELYAGTGTGRAYIAVDLDDSFTTGLGSDENVRVEIDYYDPAHVGSNPWGGFALIYQAKESEEDKQITDVNRRRAASKRGFYQQLFGSGATGPDLEGWQTARFSLEDASFANDCIRKDGKGYDFYITVSDDTLTTDHKRFMGTSPENVVIGAVRVYVEKTFSPFDITVDTGEAGNVFTFETADANGGQGNHRATFDISLDDPDNQYHSGNIDFVVKSYSGDAVWSKSDSFTNGQYTLEIPFQGQGGLDDYGIYTLEITVTGPGKISQHELVDFSISLPGTTNKKYGTNLHYDWTVYDFAELEAQIDLVEKSGLGITRSKIIWEAVQPTPGGAFTESDPRYQNVVHANQYLDQKGLDNLVILAQTHNELLENLVGYDRDGNVYNDPNYTSRYSLRNEYGSGTYANYNKWDGYAEYAAWVASDSQLGQYTDYFALMNEYNLMGPKTWNEYDTYMSNHQPNSFEEYVEIAKRSYPLIKAANPSAVVVTGEVGRFEDEWMLNAYESGLDAYSDVMSYHQYEQHNSPEYYRDTIDPYDGGTWRNISPWKSMQQIQPEVLAGRSDDSVWMTETGWAAKENNIGVSAQMPSNIDEAGKWMPRLYVLYGAEVEKVFNYCFADTNTDHFYMEENFGMVRGHDYRTPFAAKPAFLTVSAMNYFTGGSAPVQPTIIDDGGVRTSSTFVLNFPEDSSRARYTEGLVMAWYCHGVSESGRPNVRPNVSGAQTLSVYDMYGNWVEDIANNSLYTMPEIDVVYYFVKKN